MSGFETTAAEVSRNFGQWQDRAMQGAVRVTHHGRPRVVILSADEYDRLIGVIEGRELETPRDPADQASDPVMSADAALAELMTGMGEGFLALDANLRISEANPAAQAYLGKTDSQLRGQQVCPPDVSERAAVVLDRLRWVVRSGESVSFESASFLRPGRRLGVRGFPYRGGVGVIFSNLTALHVLRSEQAAWHAEREAMAAHGQICLASLNVLGFFVGANGAFLDFAGFTEEQLEEVRLADLAAPAARHDLTRGLNGLLQQTSTTYRADVEFLTRDQHRQILRIAVTRRMRDDVCEGFAVVALPSESPGADKKRPDAR